MKTSSSLLALLVLLLISGPVRSQDAGTEELGLGDTSIGEPSDIGAPDPLSAEGSAAQDDVPMPEILDLGEDPPAQNGENLAAPPSSPAEEMPPSPDIIDNPETRVSEPEPPVEAPPMNFQDSPADRSADGPDFRREQNFHSIYKKYNVDPTPLDQWEQAATGRRSQVYKVQKGDTLWDLSKTLFDQPDYWPKVWALNKDEVTNPHQIETWMQIRFFPGDLQDAPTLAVAERPGVPLSENDADPAVNVPSETPDSSLIPKAKKRAPLVRKLPDSLPVYRPIAVKIPPTNFDGLKAPAVIPPAQLPLSYYITDELPGGGVIREAEAGSAVAMDYQYVFVEVGNPDQRVFTVIKDVGKVSGDSGTGRIVEVQGELEILGAAGEEGMYRAIVKKTLSPIEVGSTLVPGSLATLSSMDGEPSLGGPSMRVVGAQFSNQRSMADAEGLIFLDGGSNQGVSEGQIYPVYSNRRLRVAKTRFTDYGDLIGHVRIAKVSSNFSTGYVTKMTAEILVGDRVGGTPGGGASAALQSTPADSSFSGEEMDLPSEDPGGMNGGGAGVDDFDLLEDESTPALEEPAPLPPEPAPEGAGGDSEFGDFEL